MHNIATLESLTQLLDRDVLVCPCCGPFQRVLVELWPKDAEAPVALQLVQHTPDMGLVVFEEFELAPPPPVEMVPFFYCAECMTLMEDRIPMTWFDAERVLGEGFLEVVN